MIVHTMIKQSQVLLHTIQNQAFNLALSQGTLPKHKFIFYMVQDALYLADYARALALTAGRLPDSAEVQEFIQFALEAINEERLLHSLYLPAYQSLHEQNPSCFLYTNYLLRMAALSPVEEAVASLLPCFYIYHAVGKKMAAQSHKNNPYQEWIDLYSSTAFETSVQKAIACTNKLGNQATEKQKEAMIKAFMRATQLEWQFWESMYAEEQWVRHEVCDAAL